VGVVPVALLAAIFHAEWAVLLEVVVGIVLTFGTRFLGLWLTTPKQETEEEGLVDY
jgi:type IV secretory pathway VirB2 component (pilin)